jgi:CO/xanthine dehydrogenase Mo-binding subunit
MECVIDEISEKLGVDPLDFRILNATHEGDRQATGPIFMRIGNVEVQTAAKESPHYATPLIREPQKNKRRGRGVATGYWNGGGNRSSVNLSIHTDGTATLVEGSVDIGGSRASIAMQAAEALGIPSEDVRPGIADTDSIGYNDMTGGSRTTYATGYAAYNEAQEAIQKMCERAARVWDIKPEEVEYTDRLFRSKLDSEQTMTFKQVANRFNQTGGPVSATGTVHLRGGTGSFGTSVVDVEVDLDTGKVDIVRYTIVQDAGKAIHPSYVEGQMQGGAVQGIGWALNEEYYMSDKGVMENATFLDYRMPTSLDVPMIETVIVEVPNPNHPYGVRGVGETSIVHPTAAIANAIFDAVGLRLTQVPMKPSRVLGALVGFDTPPWH